MSETVRQKANQSLALVEEVTAVVLPEPADANAVVPLEKADKAEGIHRALGAWVVYEPGQLFHYSDINFILLGALIEKISRHQGVAVILTHPNITDHKLRFVEGVADYWRGRAWMGTVAQFGQWWSQRDALETDVVARGGRWYLQSASSRPVEAVTITLPKQGGRRVDLSARAGRRETPL